MRARSRFGTFEFFVSMNYELVPVFTGVQKFRSSGVQPTP